LVNVVCVVSRYNGSQHERRTASRIPGVHINTSQSQSIDSSDEQAGSFLVTGCYQSPVHTYNQVQVCPTVLVVCWLFLLLLLLIIIILFLFFFFFLFLLLVNR